MEEEYKEDGIEMFAYNNRRRRGAAIESDHTDLKPRRYKKDITSDESVSIIEKKPDNRSRLIM